MELNLNFDCESYWIRMTKGLIHVWILLLIIGGVAIINNYSVVLFPLIVFITPLIIKVYIKERFCLMNICIDSNDVFIKGFQFNKLYEVHLPLQETRLELKSVYLNAKFSYKLNFIDKNNNVVFYLYPGKKDHKKNVQAIFLFVKEKQGASLSLAERLLFDIHN